MLDRQECVNKIVSELLGCSVDLVRKHSNNDAFLLKQIEKDGIDIIGKIATSIHSIDDFFWS